jgi:predicted metal-dependent phosphoesterase TrpH
MEAMEEQETRDGGVSSARPSADLHTHTNFSDGVLSPEGLVRKAKSVGLEAIAISDHDNVGALEEAAEVGRSIGVEVIPGLELSATLGEKDVHILAYFFDPSHTRLLEYLEFFRLERLRRAERIVQKLNGLDIPLSIDAVLDKAGIGSVGRPHIASALVEEGHIQTYHEAFSKYIGARGPAYESKYQLSPGEAVRLIAQAGGLSFFAHPGKYTTESDLVALMDVGLDGIEVIHPSHSPSMQQHYRSLASQYFLLHSGGSDYHGGKKNDDLSFGSYGVPMSVVEDMRRRCFR